MFQSTHPRRVRQPLVQRQEVVYECFNPRTHVGCDLMSVPEGTFAKRFNPRTHVGCDTPFFKIINLLLSFNPRTHVGCDEDDRNCILNNGQFQSTHPRRVRHYSAFGFCHNAGFNPRTHVGCDVHIFRLFLGSHSFNPRTHVGCDKPCEQLCFWRIVSIHAPT